MSQWHAQREIHEERTGTVQRINIELWIALDQFAIGETSRGLTIAFDQLAARLPIMKSIPKSASLQ